MCRSSSSPCQSFQLNKTSWSGRTSSERGDRTWPLKTPPSLFPAGPAGGSTNLFSNTRFSVMTQRTQEQKEQNSLRKYTKKNAGQVLVLVLLCSQPSEPGDCLSLFSLQPHVRLATGPRQEQRTFYEFRTYCIRPDQNTAFLKLTSEKIHLRTAHSQLIGYWAVEYGGLNQVFHIWKYGKKVHVLQGLPLQVKAESYPPPPPSSPPFPAPPPQTVTPSGQPSGRPWLRTRPGCQSTSPRRSRC